MEGRENEGKGYDMNGNLILSKVGEGVYIVRGEELAIWRKVPAPNRCKVGDAGHCAGQFSAQPGKTGPAPGCPAHIPVTSALHRVGR
jgi:hypothetical protein